MTLLPQWAAWLADAPEMPRSVTAAAFVTFAGGVFGTTCALIFAKARPLVRVVLLTGLICLLALPAPPLHALPSFGGHVAAIACAAGRALALVALFCIPSAAAIHPGLRRAARFAGATPLRAWRDTVFTQLWLPASLGLVAAWLRP